MKMGHNSEQVYKFEELVHKVVGYVLGDKIGLEHRK